MKWLARLSLTILGLSLCWTSCALAQAEVNPEAIQEISKLIRWSGVFTSLFMVFGAWIILRFSRRSVDGLSDQFPARRLTLQKLSTIFQFSVYVTTIVIVLLLSFRLDKNVLAVIGGTLAVSVGFAIKDLVASFIAGIIIMWDRPFQVGDRVAFGGEYGDITAIGLRSVRMQTLNDNIVTIPNNKFLNDITSSGNYGALEMMVVMDFFVGVDQDVGKARDIVNEAALTSRYIHLPKPVVVLVTQEIQDNYIAVRLRLKAYVLDTKHEKIFETDVHLRVMQAFRESAIFPPAILHRTPAAKQAAI